MLFHSGYGKTLASYDINNVMLCLLLLLLVTT